MDAVTVINSELGIPKSYIKNYKLRRNRSFVVVHCDWLASLLTNNEIPEFIYHSTLSGDEIQSLFFDKENLGSWCQLLVAIVEKPKPNELIIPLQRARINSSNKEADLSFAQLLHYISESNFKNVWKHNYKKYIGDKVQNKSRDYFRGNSMNKNNDILVEIIKRFYGCRIILGNNMKSEYFSISHFEAEFEPHANILPALCAIETENWFLILHNIEQITTLKDCVAFSPTIINSNYTKPLFVIYQLLQLMKNSHDKGLILGNLQLDDIFINDSLFVQVIPDLAENICKGTDIDCDVSECVSNEPIDKIQLLSKYSTNKLFTVVPSFPQDSNLEVICDKWINKQISNFDYLMYLNHVAGRRFGDPSCHFIMPWVSDFSTRSNGPWRDLSKSKFRLNKGDRQLDLTYENALNSSQIPHHVSDVLSEITYYVYLSRRTPRSILCKHVRSVWVPAEYPSSVQRLQVWTPDECIPEFFYDPTIFKSIHEDLPDLELPHWALTPEEFIEAHRECLESKYVSERLHHWIDLTFGYKLSGSAAIKSKNVCLHLVESHRSLKTTGIVQLFHHPHPPRQAPVQFFEKMPPKILSCTAAQQPKASMSQSDKGAGGSEDEGQSSGNGEDDSFGTKNSPLIFSKLLSRSKGSLLAPFQSSSNEDRSDIQKGFSGSQTSNVASSSSSSINLPKEFNPSGFLTATETNQNFFRRTFLTTGKCHSETGKRRKANSKGIVANKRIQEMQVLGCLIIELFLQSKIRVIDLSSLEKRLTVCSNFASHESLPCCLRSGIGLLLHPHKDLEPYITCSGLPLPSAHQLLQPLLTSFLFPFPKLFPVVYSSVCNLISCTKAMIRHRLWNPREDALHQALNILKIKKLKMDLERIWEDSWFAKNDQMVELVFPFIKELFDDPATSKLSIVLFLDRLCKSLGPMKTNDLLLETITNLYNSNSAMDTSENLYLYHKKFLLILIVRCGLKVFLDNFVGPLMEVVGRYKDYSDEKWEPKLYANEQDGDSDVENTVNPEDVESSPEVELKKDEKEREKQEMEVEVFSFDQDDSCLNTGEDELARRAVEHLDLNLALDGDSQAMEEDVSSTPGLTRLQSPEIAIPGGSKRFTTSPQECDAGERNVGCNWGGAENVNFDQECLDPSQIKASDVAGDSIMWLAHRLGPVLTSRYLIRNLLRVLSLCFTGNDNLEPCKSSETDNVKLWKISILKWKVVGDENVETVLRVLGEITELYGEQIILLQYLPFMSELINLSKKKFTLTLEGGVIGCITLLKHIVPFMNDTTLMDELQDVILKTIIHPVIRLVSSTRLAFPSGSRGRYALVAKLIDCLYLISLRIGMEMTKVHIAVPALQRFFLTFDKAHGLASNYNMRAYISAESSSNSSRSTNDNRHVENQREGSTTGDVPNEAVSSAYVWSQESLDLLTCDSEHQCNSSIGSKALTELKSVFDARLAHQCYATFYRFLGDTAMENCLKNHNLIRDLYYRYEQEQSLNSQRGRRPSQEEAFKENIENQDRGEGGGSFGSNVAIVGNKIELHTVGSADSLVGINGVVDAELSACICREKRDSGRHLRGNWLAYWEHEIGRSEKDNKFNFKQIKLQNFTGHGNSVRMIYCLENENSFISGSKDKTVKLWSLRSQGDGSSSNNCQFTYSHHRKSLLSLSYISPMRFVASCDSTIHLWDPFVGKTISVMDNTRVAPINVIKALNPPSCNIVAATTDATLKIVDSRLCSFVSEYRISLNSVGLIRSISVSSNGHWIAVGQASGQLTVLDVRTGMILSSWKGHEAEVLQLSAVNDNVLMSSSLDQTVSAWNVSDGKFKFCMKGPTEPVHCLAVYGSELITGTTANRIGVHTSIDGQASFSSTKLRSDAFKGILTSMAILPLNKLLLLGADNGNITLLC